MVGRSKSLKVPSGSDLAVLLEREADGPMVRETGRQRFQVVREEEDIWADYDADAVQAALNRVFGILSGVDAEALKAELRAQRDQDSQGRPA